MEQALLSIRDIIRLAGGPQVVADATGGEVSVEAVYKWPKIGIPDRHWPAIIRLTGVSADKLLEANIVARREAA